MDILYDERAESKAHQVWHLLTNHVYDLIELRLALMEELDEHRLLSEVLFNLLRPDDTRNGEDHLTRPAMKPPYALIV